MQVERRTVIKEADAIAQRTGVIITFTIMAGKCSGIKSELFALQVTVTHTAVTV